MKRGLLCIAAALVLAAGMLWLQSRRSYDAADTVEEGGVRFYLRKDRGEAFAGAYQWDGSGDAVDYVIPDTVQGVKVTAIGGLTGGLKKVPAAGLAVNMPERYRGAERAQYTVPEHAAEITLTVRLHIGRYVSHIESIGLPVPTAYYGAAENYVVHQVWQVTCDPLNPTYYAEGGRLYLRADSSPADIPCE